MMEETSGIGKNSIKGGTKDCFLLDSWFTSKKAAESAIGVGAGFSYLYVKFSILSGSLVVRVYFKKVQLQYFNDLFCFHILFVFISSQYILFTVSIIVTFLF